MDTDHPGLPSLTATTPYWAISLPMPTPSVPAMESPTISTRTGGGNVVMVADPDAPAVGFPSTAASARTEAAATSLTPTVARKVVSTARLAASGMAVGAHQLG